MVVGIINYKDYDLLPYCLASVKGQSFPASRILLLDNATEESRLKLIEKGFPEVEIIAREENLGFAAGANFIINAAFDCDYVLILNPDVELALDFIQEMITAAEAEPKVGMFSGKLLRKDEPGIIDSAGIVATRARRFKDRGTGLKDRGQYDRARAVFGVTGAVAFYRRAMLEDIALAGEYFDSDFFIHKEDVDLAWRAQLLGWKCLYLPQALAYHYRKSKAGGPQRMSREVRRYALRNKYLMMIKNEIPSLFWRDIHRIAAWELARLFLYFLLDPMLIKVFIPLPSLVKRAWAKRRWIMSQRRASAEEMLKLFAPASPPGGREQAGEGKGCSRNIAK